MQPNSVSNNTMKSQLLLRSHPWPWWNLSSCAILTSCKCLHYVFILLIMSIKTVLTQKAFPCKFWHECMCGTRKEIKEQLRYRILKYRLVNTVVVLWTYFAAEVIIILSKRSSWERILSIKLNRSLYRIDILTYCGKLSCWKPSWMLLLIPTIHVLRLKYFLRYCEQTLHLLVSNDSVYFSSTIQKPIWFGT